MGLISDWVNNGCQEYGDRIVEKNGRVKYRGVWYELIEYNQWCEEHPSEDIRNMYFVFQQRNKRLKESGNKVLGKDSIMSGTVSAAHLSLMYPYYLVLHEFYTQMYERTQVRKEKVWYRYGSLVEAAKPPKKSLFIKLKTLFKWI